MKRFLLHLIAAFLALYLATLLIPGVYVKGGSEQFLKTLSLAGIVLAVINYFLKPIINLITFPLKILTFGLFGLIINIIIVWLVDILFPSLVIFGILPLLGTAFLVLITSFFALKISKI